VPWTIKLAIVALLVVSACFLFEHDTRLGLPDNAPVEVRLGCALAETRCTRCHTADRIVSAKIESPAHWREYVHRMRLQPQSGILPDEEAPITRCLVFRTFGAEALPQVQP